MADHSDPGLDQRLASLDPLHDPVRRSLYLYVAAQPHEVSRDEAAGAVKIQRSLAAFHLDRLAEAGLVEVSYRRLSGRQGPGAGRPAKLYRRSTTGQEVSLPPKDYALAAELLAQAVESQQRPGLRSGLHEVARRFGQELGRKVRDRLGRRASLKRQIEALGQALGAQGYQPYLDDKELRLRNCPFHALAEAHRELVCGMNLALIEGVVAGMEAEHLVARLQRRPDQCCVAIGPAGHTGGEAREARGSSAQRRRSKGGRYESS